MSWTRAQVIPWVIHGDWEVSGLTHWHPVLNSASTTDYPYILPVVRFYSHVNHGIRHCISKVVAVNSHHGLVTQSCALAKVAPRRTTCTNAGRLLLWTWPNHMLHLDFQLRSDLLAVLWNTSTFLFSPYSSTCSIEYTPMAKFNKLSARNFNQIFNLSTMQVRFCVYSGSEPAQAQRKRLLVVSLKLGSQRAVTPLSRSGWPAAERQL